MNKKMDIRSKVRKNILENVENKASLDYMFIQNISQIKEQAEKLLSLDHNAMGNLIKEHPWAVDHIATSKDDIEEVFNFIFLNLKQKK